MADLCLLAEDGSVAQRWAIGYQPVAVGRDETADIIIRDDTLSRRHFMIWREGDSFLVKDLDSQNGTWVDGQRVRATTLGDSVCIAVGRTLFMFGKHCLQTSPAGVVSAAMTAQRTGGDVRIAASPDAPVA